MRRGGAKLLLVLGSLLFLLLIGGIAEIAVRIFSAVDLLGNSKDLFVANAYGASKGNAPNVEAISYGATVYTDEHGFRVPKRGLPEDERKTEAILILSDSVGFGAAVEDEGATFAGLLRKRFAAKRIYNSSVIGYSTPDYRNVVDAFVPAHPEVRAVVLVYCLNDATSAIAQTIDRYLKEKDQLAPEQRLTERLRSFTPLSDANDFLRARSKLYLFVRHRLLGTQTRDWKAALQLYSEERTPELVQSVRDVAAIAATLSQGAIPFVVVVSPFEYQLRKPDEAETQLPQKRLGELLSGAGVGYIDARAHFDASRPSTDYFLAYDSTHFSALGHRVIADVIAEALERGDSCREPHRSGALAAAAAARGAGPAAPAAVRAPSASRRAFYLAPDRMAVGRPLGVTAGVGL